MFEPTNIAAEIIALTALANSTLPGSARDRVRTADFKHVTSASFIEFPAPGGVSAMGGPRVPPGAIFLLTHFSFYTATEPPVNGDLAVNFGLGSNATTVRLGYNLSTVSIDWKANALGVHLFVNRPMIFIFPSESFPVLWFTDTTDPRTDLTIGLYGNWHGYFLPAGYQPIFSQFETQLKTQQT